MYLKDIETLLVEMGKKQTNISTILWGPTGIGKSSVVKRVAEILGYTLIDLRLSMREAVDVLGMPYTGLIKVRVRNPLLGVQTEQEMDVDALMHYPPEFFVRALYEGKAVLFLDELNRARPEVLQAVFQLALDRELNGKKLPSDVMIVSACNPPDKRYDTVKFDDALTARFMHLKAKTTADQWLDWAKLPKKGGNEANVHSNVTAFIATQKESLMVEDKADSELNLEINPCPRSWEMVSRLENLSLPDNILTECVAGLVNTKIAMAYMQSRQSADKPITLDELFQMTDDPNDPIRVRVKRYTSTESKKDGIHKVRLDLLKETCADIERREPDCRKYRKQVIDFLEIIPKDLTTKTIQAIYTKDRHTKDPVKWADIIMDRESLATALNSMMEAQKRTRSN